MKWEKKKLGECCLSIADGDHQAPPKVPSGIPFVTIRNINSNNQFDFSETMFVPEAYYNALDTKRKARKDDVLYSVVGSFGIPVFMKESYKFAFQRHIAILRPDAAIVNPKFLYYTMRSADFYAKADAVAIGSAQRTITLSSLRNMEIELTSLEIQDKIADILSAYDDLIENNRKQIRLLEEAARRLYKEWFVDFRFPGHEAVPLVDGVPEGWEKGVLGDIAVFKRGKTITKAQVHDGNVPVVAGGLSPAYYHNVANTVAPVITVSGSGANAGFANLYSVDVFASDCSFADSKTTPYLYFVYCFVKSNKKSLDSLQKGSAQPHVYAKDINALELWIPTKDVLERFCELVTVYFGKIKLLQQQIEGLSEARDRLLPKLMSGEVDV